MSPRQKPQLAVIDLMGRSFPPAQAVQEVLSQFKDLKNQQRFFEKSNLSVARIGIQFNTEDFPEDFVDDDMCKWLALCQTSLTIQWRKSFLIERLTNGLDKKALEVENRYYPWEFLFTNPDSGKYYEAIRQVMQSEGISSKRYINFIYNEFLGSNLKRDI